MKKWKEIVSLLSLCFILNGCAVYMAAQQPGKKNLDVLNSGMPRDEIIAQFGMPISSETVNGSKVEMYRFTQGYSKGVKISRAVFHGVADVFTLFIWELIGTPTEAIANGKEMTVKVKYTADDRVDEVNFLQKN